MIHTNLIAPIGELIRRQAVTRPNAPAYSDKSRAVTYAELAENTACLAMMLQNAGVKPGQTVALYLPHSVAWVESCIAILRAGAIVVPISIDSTESEINYRLADAGCVVMIAKTPHPTVTTLSPDNPSAATALPNDPTDIDQASFIVYTSGTTGQAKGVLLSLRGMLWVTAACWAPIAGLNQDDVILNPLPLYHSYALNLSVFSVLATGASEYILERFSTSEILRLIDTQRFTMLPGVPTMFRFLLDSAKSQGKASLGGIRICLSAGAVLAGPLNQDFEDHFGIKLLDGYGITETSTMVTLNWPTGARVMGSCGVPVPGLAVRLVDPNDIDVPEGELIVRGPNVMLGYHNKPEATAAALKNGWYRTGDLARYDPNGYLTITGRLKEIIIRGGQNISPVEVEETLARHPSVADCAVVGIPHDLLGEVPVAFVVIRQNHNADPAALLDHCKSLLSVYKVPQSFHIVSEIPRTGSGKAMRFKLKQFLPPA